MTGAVESDCYSLRGQRVTPLDPQYIKNIAYALCHVLNLKPSITKRMDKFILERVDFEERFKVV